MLDDMGTCDFCGDEYQMRRMVEIEGDHYCPECKTRLESIDAWDPEERDDDDVLL